MVLNVNDIDPALVRRIYGEYLEMPGLQLTLPQASRLWALDPATAARVLTWLAEASLLRRVGDYYVLAGPVRRCA